MRLIDADILQEQVKTIDKPAWMIVRDAPTIEAEPVRRGRWVEGVPYICSECGKPAPEEENNSEHYKCWLSPYCPHCGAKMDGGC